MAIMNQIKELEDGTVPKVLGNPDYLQTAKEGTQAYNELMKGYKSDSMSASPMGPL